jgi:hypothetical protein
MTSSSDRRRPRVPKLAGLPLTVKAIDSIPRPPLCCLFQLVPGGIAPRRFGKEALGVELTGIYCEPGAARIFAALASLRQT